MTTFCPTILEETTPGVCRWRIVTHRSSWARRVQPGSGRIGGNQTERSENDRVEGIVTMMDGPMDGPMGGQMEEQMVLLQNMSTDWGNWMQSVGAQEVMVEVEGVGTRAAVTSRVLRPRGLLRRAQWAKNEMPVELVRDAVRLRVLMAHPRGGTWTWALLSMKSSEGYKLISDFDYDREPVLDPPYTAEDCAKELEVFPRDPGAIPDWMKIGV